MKEIISSEELRAATETSDIMFAPFAVCNSATNKVHSNEIPEMIASIEPLRSCFCLTDPSDPRHQYLRALRRRFGAFLHKASLALQRQGEENTVDAVLILVCASIPFRWNLHANELIGQGYPNIYA